jgi:RND superfamily putative drug exporter
MSGLLFGSLTTMVQTGFIIGMGILIDTFVVRTVTVPALAALIGPANWWPAKRTHAGRTRGATYATETPLTDECADADFSHRLATNDIRRAARQRRSLSQRGKRARNLSVAGARR